MLSRLLKKVVSPEFKAADHEVYLFAAPYDQNGQPKMTAIKGPAFGIPA